MAFDPVETWITQLRKGLLKYCLLTCLERRPQYGYDIVRRLAAVGALSIGIGTVYPILKRLAREGLVESYLQPSREGAPRKYHRLTAHGREVLTDMNARWDGILAGLDILRRTPGAPDVPALPEIPVGPADLFNKGAFRS